MASFQKKQISEYLDHFFISQATLQRVFDAALSSGADFCDIFFQHKISHSIGLEDQEVDRAYSQVDFGAGIRVVSGDQTGYSFVENITTEAMIQAAKTAARIAAGSKTIPPIAIEERKIDNYYPVETSWETVSINEKIPVLQKLNQLIFDRDPRVIKASISFADETNWILIVNSEGKLVADYQPMTQIVATCTAEEKGKREQNYANRAARMGIEFLSDKMLSELARELVDKTMELFQAIKPIGGEMEVVLGAGSSGILLHEAIGHGMEADFNRKKISIFHDKMNQPIAESFVSIVDDATVPHARGSINVDDEGNPGQKTFLVENGILRSYLHDRISARHFGVEPTGSGRRQSFRYPPLPRMRNTYMLPGPHKREEIIESVKKGLYAESFSNGQVFIGAGDFTFYVKNGYLIEDGQLTRPVKDINIIGNGPEVLRQVVMVADDFKMDQGGWTCGKDGQNVPVSLGLPTIKVKKITVGGNS